MKFITVFIIALALVFFLQPKEEYKVTATYSVAEVLQPKAKTAEYKPHTTDALEKIPATEEWEVISKFKHAVLISQIYAGESGFGRADVCRSRGGYNGFGYAEPNPLKNGPTCYSSFEEVVEHVNNWIDARLNEGFNLAELNCYYVRGVRASQCDTSYKLN